MGRIPRLIECSHPNSPVDSIAIILIDDERGLSRALPMVFDGVREGGRFLQFIEVDPTVAVPETLWEWYGKWIEIESQGFITI